MANMTSYLENALVNLTLRGVAFTPPAAVYLALYNSAPTEQGTGAEVVGGGYARRQITFSAPLGGLTSNSGEVSFPVATANWGAITHIAIFNAATGGNMLYYGQLLTTRTILANDQLKVNPGDISVVLS